MSFKLKPVLCTIKKYALISDGVDVTEFFLERITVFLSAIMSGALLTFSFRLLDKNWKENADTFVNNNFEAVSLLKENYPALVAMVLAVLIALLWKPLARLALILWDGMVFATISFLSVAFCMILLARGVAEQIDPQVTNDLLKVLFFAFIIYVLLVPFVLYKGLFSDDKDARSSMRFVATNAFSLLVFLSGKVLVPVLISIFSLVWIAELVRWVCHGIVKLARFSKP